MHTHIYVHTYIHIHVCIFIYTTVARGLAVPRGAVRRAARDHVLRGVRLVYNFLCLCYSSFKYLVLYV